MVLADCSGRVIGALTDTTRAGFWSIKMNDVTVTVSISRRSRLAAAYALEAIAEAIRSGDVSTLPNNLILGPNGVGLDIQTHE